jgi:hypothetical protein
MNMGYVFIVFDISFSSSCIRTDIRKGKTIFDGGYFLKQLGLYPVWPHLEWSPGECIVFRGTLRQQKLMPKPIILWTSELKETIYMRKIFVIDDFSISKTAICLQAFGQECWCLLNSV